MPIGDEDFEVAPRRALVAGRSQSLVACLQHQLTELGFAVDVTRALDEVLAAIRLGAYSIVIFSRELVSGDGSSLLREIAVQQPMARRLVIASASSAAERIAALEAGADDYLSGNLDPGELQARIRALLRRSRAGARTAVLRHGSLAFCPDTYEVTIRGQPMPLPRRQLALLGALMARARRVVTRETLVREVYGFDEEPSSNTLEAHVSRLRRHLKAIGAGVVIEPVRSIGYRLSEQNDRERCAEPDQVADRSCGPKSSPPTKSETAHNGVARPRRRPCAYWNSTRDELGTGRRPAPPGIAVRAAFTSEDLGD